MPERTVFCSYARRDAAAVAEIAADLDRLGQRPWLDQRLSGGQAWWDTILDRVRTCDCFLFVLSDASLRSKACMAEVDYAHRLGRIILPVAVGPVIDQILPPYLAETQRVEAGDTHQLARALLSLPAPPPLPDPLPPPPPVPISYLDHLASEIARDELTTAEQRNLAGELRQRLREPDEREAAAVLLRRLRHHHAINAWVAAEIDEQLARLEAPEPPPPSPMPTPPGPGPQGRGAGAPPHGEPPRVPAPRRRAPDAGRRRAGRGRLVAAVLLVAVLATAGVAAWIMAGGDGETPPAGRDQPVSPGETAPPDTPDQGGGTTSTDGETTTTTTTTTEVPPNGGETGG